VEHRGGALTIGRIGAVAAEPRAHDRPEVARGLVDAGREAVVTEPSVLARLHPPLVRQRLQVPAHRRLGDLQHGAELPDRELATVEQREDADPRLVAERVEVVQDGWRAQCIHRFEYEYMVLAGGDNPILGPGSPVR
jgi:hypothetical protein